MKLAHPFADLSKFPTASCKPSVLLWRVTGAVFAETPWWYSNSGSGRFDLAPNSGHGTCYLAETPLGCLLETIWRDAAPTGDPDMLPPIAPSEVASLRAVQVEVATNHRCANVTGNAKVQLYPAYGITDAIANRDDYQLPQQWAAAWHAHGLDGVYYRIAHGSGLYAWALFGEEGARDWLAVSVHEINDDLLANHELNVDPAPALDELDVVDDLNEALALIAEATGA